jgi:leucyl-tRNA synthetase
VKVATDADQETAVRVALAEPGVSKFVTGEPRKVVYVAGRLVNIVV